MPLIIGSNAPTGYKVDNSLRFDDGSSDYLNRTPASAGSQTTWTWSCWVKRSGLGTNQSLLSTGTNTSDNAAIFFTSSDELQFRNEESSSAVISVVTDAVFRDVSAWYHIVFSFDSTQAGVTTDRLKIYVNGIEQSYSVPGSIALNETSYINDNVIHKIGGLWAQTGTAYVEGYMSEVVFIDGTALDPTSFGEFDTNSGIWKPIDVSGLTFGTNGFYLEFKDSSALGDDTSGNSNDFTVNNLTSIDQTTDTPTNNFCTMNSLIPNLSTYSNGNTKIVTNSGERFGGSVSTMGFSKGKYVFEVKVSSFTDFSVGIASEDVNFSDTANKMFSRGSGTIAAVDNESIYVDGSAVQTSLGSFSSGDIVSVYVDHDNYTIDFKKNGTSYGTQEDYSLSALAGKTIFFYVSDENNANTSTFEVNFGNPPFTISSGNSDANGYGNFEYAVPSGYYALNTKNLATYG